MLLSLFVCVFYIFFVYLVCVQTRVVCVHISVSVIFSMHQSISVHYYLISLHNFYDLFVVGAFGLVQKGSMLKASGEKVDVAIKAMKGRCGIFKNRDLILFLKIIDVCTAVCTAIHRNLIFYIFLMKSCVCVLFLALTLLLMINLPYQFFIICLGQWANLYFN